MEETENKGGNLGIRLKPEPTLKSTHIIERFINHGQSDDGVDNVAVDSNVKVYAEQHRGRMTNGKETYINTDMLQSVQEENDAEQEQDMIVASHHVLGTEIDKRQDVDAAYFLNIALVTFCHSVCERTDYACAKQQGR